MLNEILKKIDEDIEMYQKRIDIRKGTNYHDETERILRFEERMNEAIRIKEIIQTEMKNPKTNFAVVTESPEKLSEAMSDEVCLCCDYLRKPCDPSSTTGCKTGILAWLNQEAKEDEKNG
jgi:hypothetical protein